MIIGTLSFISTHKLSLLCIKQLPGTISLPQSTVLGMAWWLPWIHFALMCNSQVRYYTVSAACISKVLDPAGEIWAPRDVRSPQRNFSCLVLLADLCWPIWSEHTSGFWPTPVCFCENNKYSPEFNWELSKHLRALGEILQGSNHLGSHWLTVNHQLVGNYLVSNSSWLQFCKPWCSK